MLAKKTSLASILKHQIYPIITKLLLAGTFVTSPTSATNQTKQGHLHPLNRPQNDLKDSKKGSPKHLVGRNSACLTCNSYLSRHDLPIFDSTNNIQQHPKMLPVPRKPMQVGGVKSLWVQNLKLTSQVVTNLHANLKHGNKCIYLPTTQMRTERSEQKHKNRS